MRTRMLGGSRDEPFAVHGTAGRGLVNVTVIRQLFYARLFAESSMKSHFCTFRLGYFRAGVILCFAVNAAQLVVADEVVHGEIYGKRISAVVPTDSLERQPLWDGDSDDTPPLAVSTALKKSRLALDKTYPQLRADRPRFRKLELRKCSIQTETENTLEGPREIDVFMANRWLYVVEYRYAVPMAGPKYQNTIPVIVLMDGSVHVAVSRGDDRKRGLSE